MSKKTTNFFELYVTPPVESLFVTENQQQGISEPSDNLVVNYRKDSIISLNPLRGSKEIASESKYIEWLVKRFLFSALEKSDDIFDVNPRKGEFTLINEKLAHTNEYSILLRIKLRVFHVQDISGRNRLMLSIDPITKLYNRLSIDKLIQRQEFRPDDFLTHNDCLVFVEKRQHRLWARGRIRGYEGELIKVEVPYLFNGTIQVSSNRVVPSLPLHLLASIAQKSLPNLDLYQQKKQLSSIPAKRKKELIRKILDDYIRPLFPRHVGNTTFEISAEPLDTKVFPCYQISIQDEPEYVIDRDGFPEVRDKRRLAGLSKVNIKSNIKKHKVVLFATRNSIDALEDVLSKLNEGIEKGNYRFSLPERFGIELVETDRFIVSNFQEYIDKSDSFLLSNEEKHEDALPLVYLPQKSELYYPLKAKLAHYGKVSQVISQPNMDIYGLWNLATNIYAKLGYPPWGISENPESPNADIVLGFAYSSLKSSGKLRRNIGYVNVFDKNGVWLFMQSSSSYLEFQNRTRLIPEMLRKAIRSYLARGNPPRIIDLHYSKRFSYEERKRTLDAIITIAPEIEQVNFISIDNTHPFRVFDENNVNLNFQRGGIVLLNPGEFLLSVSSNKKPDAPASRLLKVRVWRESTPIEQIDIEPIAFRILAMTKLNWRSAVTETSEPVTLKYAEEIARLTNHFSLTEWAEINNQLSRIPWFI